jgi:hypothetical protein
VVKIILMIVAILMLWSSNATAQKQSALGDSCLADLNKLCPGIPPGQGRLRACMREHIKEISSPCLLRLAKFAEVRGSQKECGDYIRQQCANVEREGGKFSACLKSAVASLSNNCKAALARAVSSARSR